MLSFEDQQDIDEVDGGGPDPDGAPSTSGRDGPGDEGRGSSDEEGQRSLITPSTISDVEQCLAYRGGLRMRLKVTAKFGTAPDGELDVEVGASRGGAICLQGGAGGGWGRDSLASVPRRRRTAARRPAPRPALRS
jgi:hypothetical protein